MATMSAHTRCSVALLITMAVVVPGALIPGTLVPGALAETVKSGASGSAEPVFDLQRRGMWGGRVSDVAVDPTRPDIVYAAIGQRLVIFEVVEDQDGTGLVELSGIDFATSRPTAIAARGDHVFLTAQQRFMTVDVSDPANPLVLADESDGYWRLSFHRPRQMTLTENHAVLNVAGTLRGVDISDPAQPVWRGATGIGPGLVADYEIRGDLIYVVTDNITTQEVRVYEMKAFLEPVSGLPPVTLIGSAPLAGIGRGEAIAIEGDLLCTTSRPAGHYALTMGVYDISDPASPALLSSVDVIPDHDGGKFSRLEIVGGRVFLAIEALPWWNSWQASVGLNVYDIATDPTAPALIGNYKPHGAVLGVTVVGDRAFVQDGGEGLVLLDVSDPTTPVRKANYHSPAELQRAVRVGDLLYVTDAFNGISILDVSDLERPKLVGVYQSAGPNGFGTRHLDIAVDSASGFAYVATEFWGLDIVDISDPTAPAHAGLFPMPTISNTCFSLAYQDGVVSLGGKNSVRPWMRNIDVTMPTAVAEVGFMILSGFKPLRMRRAPGELLCVSTYGRWNIVDNSDVTSPLEVWSDNLGVEGWTSDLAVSDSGGVFVAYDDNPEGSIAIHDITGPLPPTLGAELEAQTISHLDEDGGVLFAVIYDPHGSSGVDPNLNTTMIAAFDLAAPGVPAVIGEVPVAVTSEPHVLAEPGGVFVLDGRSGEGVYAGEGSGLTIFSRLSCPADLNTDGMTDAADLSAFIAGFGSAVPAGTGGDLNGDGVIDAADLSVLVGDFGCVVE